MTTAVAVSVRVYEEADEAEVAALLLANGWQRTAIPSSEVLTEAAMTGCAYVAMRDGRVLGFIRVISDGEVVSYVTELAVDARARFQGIGRALVDAVAREFPKARIDLLSTSLAQSFYETLGFTQKTGYRRWPK
jgi:ribosomal protein S18 acetylase RimI-like enzyme